MSFFDPNQVEPSAAFAMGSVGHLALTVLLLVLLAVMVAFRKQLKPLRASRAFMAGSAGFVLGLETLSYVLKLVYPCHPAYERLPLHLCASLKIAITLLVLFEKYDWVKYLSVLGIGCGFISFVNLNLGGESFGNFMFWHYAIGHYYLFLAPVFLFLTGDTRYELKTHLRMCVGLAAWSFTVFLANWVFDTNYMYTGPHNTVVVPFLPDGLMAWPMNYVSYVGIAFIILNGVYLLLRSVQARMDRGSAVVELVKGLAVDRADGPDVERGVSVEVGGARGSEAF